MSTMIKVGIAPSLETPLPEMIRHAKMAEETGLDSVWYADHPSEGRDIAIALASMASSTSRMRIGPNVVNPYTRSPVLLASLIASLDELSGGRAIMGIGSGNPERLARLGVNQTKPLRYVEDSVHIIRTLLSGETFDYKSDFFSLQGASLGFEAYRKGIPIYLAGIKDKMLKLAGRIGDGALFSAGMSPSYVRRAANLVQDTRRQAKLRMSFEICATVQMAISMDPSHARSLAAPHVARALAREGRGELMLKSIDSPIAILPALRTKVKYEGTEAAGRSLSEELVKSFCPFGTPDEVSQSLNRYREAGANLLIVSIISGSDLEMAFDVLRHL